MMKLQKSIMVNLQKRISKIAIVALLIVSGGVLSDAVHTAPLPVAHAQQVVRPTPTPPAFVVYAEQTRTAADAAKAIADQKYQAYLNGLQDVQRNARTANQTAADANANVAAAQQSALALNLQDTTNYANQAAQLAQQAVTSASLALNGVKQINDAMPTIKQLTQSNTDLQKKVADLQSENGRLRQTISLMPRVTPQPETTPSLDKGIIFLSIVFLTFIVIVCVTFFMLNYQQTHRPAPAVSFQTHSSPVINAVPTDTQQEVINQ